MTISSSTLASISSFQLTRSRGAWQEDSTKLLVKKLFQLTRSRGAWRLRRNFTNSAKNFNSHAHVERDLKKMIKDLIKQISTHTLTWSVTPKDVVTSITNGFQLTRSRGAWLRLHQMLQVESNFNSHAHVERDWMTLSPSTTLIDFNSHAHVERDLR